MFTNFDSSVTYSSRYSQPILKQKQRRLALVQNTSQKLILVDKTTSKDTEGVISGKFHFKSQELQRRRRRRRRRRRTRLAATGMPPKAQRERERERERNKSVNVVVRSGLLSI